MQYDMPISLPSPDDVSAAHSARVAEHIREKIRKEGDISFASFMHEALYAPGLGYYAAGSTKFGRAGDFVTAPEISSIFGAVLGRQCAEVLASLGSGEILEFGAGSGKLATDLIRSLARVDCLPSRYRILEVSPDLAERQAAWIKSTLPELFDCFDWVSEMPRNFSGVVVANEVLDAMPCERFVRRNSAVMQQCVSVKGREFVWAQRPAPDRLRDAVLDIEVDLGNPLPAGFTSEVSLASPPWVAEMAKCLTQAAVFLFDYGVSRHEYYAADRDAGWLHCHFRHHAHNNPLILVGIQDLTTWVDFSAIAAAAVSNDLDILGFQTQSQFLLGGGLDIEMQGFADRSVANQVELSGQVKTLTLPGEMGENFKCIALGCGDVALPSTFHFADRTRTL